MEDVASLWEEFKKTGDEKLKGELIQHYLPLVRQIAGAIKQKMSAVIDFEDLVGDGIFGLIRAIELFDLSRGVKFETYATSVIRGSIYNGLRILDWVPERTRGKTRALQKVMDKFVLIHGRQGTQEELAKELKISAQEVYDLITDLSCVYLLSLDQPIPELHDDDLIIMEIVEDKKSPDPLLEVEFAEIKRILALMVEQLNEREQLIVKKHYFEGKPFEEIAHMVGVSKQRISQMHSRILRKLKELLSQAQISQETMHNIV